MEAMSNSMSKSKHTPGPWDKVLSGGYVMKGGKPFPEFSFEVKEKGESWIDMWKRTQPERDKKYEEAKANRRLQRMAPEMLEMLEHCRKVLGGEVAGWHTDVLQVEALIAKVKGEE